MLRWTKSRYSTAASREMGYCLRMRTTVDALVSMNLKHHFDEIVLFETCIEFEKRGHCLWMRTTVEALVSMNLRRRTISRRWRYV